MSPRAWTLQKSQILKNWLRSIMDVRRVCNPMGGASIAPAASIENEKRGIK